jgi:hypothetical protein
MIMSLKLKINPIREFLGLIIYPIKPSAGETIPLKDENLLPLVQYLYLIQVNLPGVKATTKNFQFLFPKQD